MSCKEYKWYSGVPHCHTVASDGALTLEQVVKKAKKSKLDFLSTTPFTKMASRQKMLMATK